MALPDCSSAAISPAALGVRDSMTKPPPEESCYHDAANREEPLTPLLRLSKSGSLLHTCLSRPEIRTRTFIVRRWYWWWMNARPSYLPSQHRRRKQAPTCNTISQSEPAAPERADWTGFTWLPYLAYISSILPLLHTHEHQTRSPAQERDIDGHEVVAPVPSSRSPSKQFPLAFACLAG